MKESNKEFRESWGNKSPDYREGYKCGVKNANDKKRRLLERSFCSDCGTKKIEWYMVHNRVWYEEAGMKSGHLCFSCLEKRIDRKLTIKDFQDLAINQNIFYGYKLAVAKEIEMIRCECCENGIWYTECCNGADGCSCEGLPINMGPCNVCEGTGYRRPDADTKANVKTIQGSCFIGSGPRNMPSYW